MARPRRRRSGDSIEGEDSIFDDDLDARVEAIEVAIEEMQAANGEMLKDYRVVRAKVEKIARELDEGAEEDDELFKELDSFKAITNEKLEQLTQANSTLIDRLAELTERMATLPGRLEEHMQRQQQELTRKLESSEAARTEEADLLATRLEEITQSHENTTARLRQELHQALQDQSRTQHLTEEFQRQIETLSREFDSTLAELSQKLRASLTETQQQQSVLRQELEATLAELADAVDSRAGNEEFSELRSELERLQSTYSNQSELGARAAQAVSKVEQLDSLLAQQQDRYEHLLSRSQGLAQETEKYADKVDLAVRLVKALDERGRGGAPADLSGSPSPSSASVSDSDLEAPEKTEFGFGLRDLLNVMASNQASDLHIKVGSTPMVRLHGDLIPVGNHNLAEEDCRRLIFAALSKEERRRLLSQRALDFTYEQPNLRLRGHAFYQRGRLCASLRLLRSQMPSLEELGLPTILRRTIASLKHGIVLVTGPLGAGKSTTLASLVDELNRTRKIHILTLESPVQFIHQDAQALITQREQGTDFQDPVRAIQDGLKHDPDCLVIDPLVNDEAATLALAAGDSGHLVLASLDAPNLRSALERLFSLSERHPHLCDRKQMASNLKAIISQRLLPRADKSKGLIPAAEVLLVNNTVSQVLAEGNLEHLSQALRQNQAGEGSQTMAQSLTKLVDAGLISESEAGTLLPPTPTSASPTDDSPLMQWL